MLDLFGYLPIREYMEISNRINMLNASIHSISACRVKNKSWKNGAQGKTQKENQDSMATPMELWNEAI